VDAGDDRFRAAVDRFEQPAQRFGGRFAAGCTLPAPATRPHDAWRLLREFDELLELLFGPRRYRPFTMPTTRPTTRQTKES